MPHSDREDGAGDVKKTGIQIIPLKYEAGKKVDFGAEVFGVDLNNFTDEEFKIIEDGLYKYKVLTFKDQPANLEPSQQYKLTSSFDDKCPGGFAHGQEPVMMVHNGVEIKGNPKRVALPCQPEVHVLGRGRVPSNHYQLPDDMDIIGVDHRGFHKEPHIDEKDSLEGATRFFQWHWDGALYDISPPRVGCLLCVRIPKGPDCTVRWDDGTGTTMKVKPGSTAYISGARALACLTPEQRTIAFNSSIEYAPYAFKWMSTTHSTRLGHTLETEGLEMSPEQLGPIDPSKIKTYPMVWTNPKTGEKSLQVHGQGALKLHLKSSPDGEVRVVDDLAEVRKFMDGIMRPAIEPENIFAHAYKEGDVILWYNRALWHSIMEFPESYGPRIMHQCNVAASDDPK